MKRYLWLGLCAWVLLFVSPARAAGTFRLQSTEAKEVSGAWHIFVTLEMQKPPSTPHVPMRFVFTPVAVYERSLVDGRSEPVTNRMAVQGAQPVVESLDVDFSNAQGKIFKGTKFDFGLTRTRGYQAGEYKVQVRTADGIEIGGTQMLTLKGDNEVVDRRAISFNAKEPGIKKVNSGIDGGAQRPGTDDSAPMPQSGDVQPSGESKPFVPADAYNKTPEEEIKERPKGCGCHVAGERAPLGLGLLAATLTLGLVLRRRRA